jgi:cytochrome c1
MRRTGPVTALAITVLVVSSCSGGDPAGTGTAADASAPSTSASAPTSDTTPEPVLTPVQRQAQEQYESIIAELDPALVALDEKWANVEGWPAYASYCAEWKGFHQVYIERLNALSWPEEYRAELEAVLASQERFVERYRVCEEFASAGGVSAAEENAWEADELPAIEEARRANAAWRAALGLPEAPTDG